MRAGNVSGTRRPWLFLFQVFVASLEAWAKMNSTVSSFDIRYRRLNLFGYISQNNVAFHRLTRNISPSSPSTPRVKAENNTRNIIP